MEIKKYYFIYFEFTRTTSQNNTTYTDVSLNRELSDIHPLQYEIESNEKYGLGSDGLFAHRIQSWENIKILSWQELSEEEYLKFKDHF